MGKRRKRDQAMAPTPSNSFMRPLHCYPQTNTNMFVLAWRLNIPEIECPRIQIFLPQRRKARQVRREKMNYLEEFFLPLFSGLCVFAGDIPSSFLRFLRPLRLIFRFRILFGCG